MARPNLVIDEQGLRAGILNPACNLFVNITKTHVTTIGGSDGTATSVVTGAVGNLTFQWSNGATTANITGLSAGQFFVTVTDDGVTNCKSRQYVTINDGAAPFLPSDLINMEVWVRADDNASFNAGSINDLDPVSAWNRQIGSGVDFTQATGSKQPTFNVDGFGNNDMPFVDFDGLSDVLNSAFGKTQPATIFVALRKKTNPSSSNRILAGSNSADHLSLDTFSPNLRLFGSGGPLTVTGLTTNPSIYTAVANTTSSTLQIDNNTPATGDCGTGEIVSLSIGANFFGSQEASMEIAEIIIYSDVKSSGNQTSVKDYLNGKYDIL